MSEFALLYDALLADGLESWTAEELTVFRRLVERDRSLDEADRAEMLRRVARVARSRSSAPDEAGVPG